ncbi:MAG: aldo/keto reductase [Dehalococcoidia bacterium]|nr:aldo/keto reductase [Dehalococcoidia bacterium]
MDYRRLGNSGLQVSVIGLGTNTIGPDLDEAKTEQVIGRFLDLGMNFIDTADTYSRGTSESHIGKAIVSLKARSKAIIATKCGIPMSDDLNDRGASRQHIVDSVHKSLTRLQTGHIDLLQIHRPDAETPIDETLRALDDVVRAGKVRYIGCSNYAAWQLVEAMQTARASHLTPYVSLQPEYNLLNRGIEAEIIPAAQRYGVGLIPYSPLAAGFLTGKYKQGQDRPADARGGKRPGPFFDRWLTERNYAAVGRLQAYADELAHPLSELAIAWLIAQPAVSVVIVGASRVEQIDANAKAAEWKLSADEVKRAVEVAVG